ncbi:hypothetical protein SAMN04488550_0883 [Gordonia malaquae]|nr:hypothetical protein [Gordonia malaquae]SEB83941.1 hypothetical protein SAMN04488550_0883 [Gordonia malaquae]
MKKMIVVLLAAAALCLGLPAGAGIAEARIETGRYTAQFVEFGAIPTPLAHARIIGNTYYQDYYGVGPRNLTIMRLTPTKRGMTASYAKDPVSLWYSRVEYRKTSYGYKGVVYSMGIPMGDMILRKVRARR